MGLTGRAALKSNEVGWFTPEQFSHCYDEHAGAVFHFARQLCGATLAADVTRDVFVGLWQRPVVIDPALGSMRNQLLTMAHRRSVALNCRTCRHRACEVGHAND